MHGSSWRLLATMRRLTVFRACRERGSAWIPAGGNSGARPSRGGRRSCRRAGRRAVTRLLVFVVVRRCGVRGAVSGARCARSAGAGSRACAGSRRRSTARWFGRSLSRPMSGRGEAVVLQVIDSRLDGRVPSACGRLTLHARRVRCVARAARAASRTMQRTASGRRPTSVGCRGPSSRRTSRTTCIVRARGRNRQPPTTCRTVEARLGVRRVHGRRRRFTEGSSAVHGGGRAVGAGRRRFEYGGRACRRGPLRCRQVRRRALTGARSGGLTRRLLHDLDQQFRPWSADAGT